VIFLVDGLQRADEFLAALVDPGQHVWRIDDIQRGFSDGAGQRVTAVGGAVFARFHHRGHVFGCQHGGNRETAAERFGSGQDVRRHAVMHVAEQLAAAPHAALYFIQHQQRLMFVTKLAQTLQKRFGRRRDTALPLHRLDNNGAGVVVDHRFYGIQIVERHVHNISGFRAEAVGVFRLATHGNREQRATVEGIMESDDLTFVRAVTVRSVIARQFKGRFVGFSAGVGEEYAVGKGGVDQLLRQSKGGFIGKYVTDMPQGFALLVQRFHQCRMAMSKRRHSDTPGEINILVPLLIPHATAFTFHGNEFRR